MKQAIEFVDITQRDGEQMEINNVTIADRIAVFDALVTTGITQFEVGHLGNSGKEGFDEGDQAYTKALIAHINEMSETDERYKSVKLQVLFGSQQGIISEGLDALEGFDKERIVIHIYDRASPNLRKLATEPYTLVESARRVAKAADLALARGFTRFSVSGEGATDCSVDEAIEYYSYIAQYLEACGATAININLANTFGMPPIGEWDEYGLAYFNSAVKAAVTGIEVTTSVHTHNDDRSAVEFSMAALRAGFDKVEGTLTGMGERSGNVALCDIMIRLIEEARVAIEATKRPRSIYRIGSSAVNANLATTRSISASVVKSLHNWYNAAVSIGSIYGTRRRFETTSLGDPEAYNAGSGPHDQASLKALQNPARNPLSENYLRIAIPHAILGRPEALGILAADEVAIKSITVNGRASGGSTKKIQKGAVNSVDSRDQAIADARRKVEQIHSKLAQAA